MWPKVSKHADSVRGLPAITITALFLSASSVGLGWLRSEDRGQIGLRVSGSRDEDWYGGSRECGHILSVMLSFSWWRQCWEPLPSSTRCDNNGTAGFGVLQAEKPHFSTWQKAGEGVRM